MTRTKSFALFTLAMLFLIMSAKAAKGITAGEIVATDEIRYEMLIKENAEILKNIEELERIMKGNKIEDWRSILLSGIKIKLADAKDMLANVRQTLDSIDGRDRKKTVEQLFSIAADLRVICGEQEIISKYVEATRMSLMKEKNKEHPLRAFLALPDVYRGALFLWWSQANSIIAILSFRNSVLGMRNPL